MNKVEEWLALQLNSIPSIIKWACLTVFTMISAWAIIKTAFWS